MSDQRRSRRPKLKMILLALGATAAANALLRRRGYDIPGRTVVRCSRGHEFTTTWIEGVSVTSLRLGPLRRLQRCRECHAWRVVRPVKRADQSHDAAAAA